MHALHRPGSSRAKMLTGLLLHTHLCVRCFQLGPAAYRCTARVAADRWHAAGMTHVLLCHAVWCGVLCVLCTVYCVAGVICGVGPRYLRVYVPCCRFHSDMCAAALPHTA